MRSPRFRIYLVTDRRVARPSLADAVSAALAAVPPGSIAVQLREKDLDGGPLLELAKTLRAVTARAGAPLYVNDRVDVALAVGADGVHLPRGGLPVGEVRRLLRGGLVGVSTHSAAEVHEAARAGADFAVLGPIFDTPSKRAYGPPLGLEPLRTAADASIPVYAVGGIRAERVAEVAAAGAAGVACISAILAAPEPAAAASALLAAFGAC